MAKRKLVDMAQMNLRIPEALRRRVETEAKKFGRSLNRELVRRIEMSFDQQEVETIIKWTAQEAATQAVAQMMHYVQKGESND